MCAETPRRGHRASPSLSLRFPTFVHPSQTATMAGNTFGSVFRVTTFGESHCKGVGAIVDGVPPCL